MFRVQLLLLLRGSRRMSGTSSDNEKPRWSEDPNGHALQKPCIAGQHAVPWETMEIWADMGRYGLMDVFFETKIHKNSEKSCSKHGDFLAKHAILPEMVRAFEQQYMGKF